VFKSQLLWVDMRCEKSNACVNACLLETYHIQVISDVANIQKLIQSYQPYIVCFDYDFPDQAGLNLLLNTRSQFPELPILMLSKEQSLELALWALRSRVWNYFVKPVVVTNFVSSLDVLLSTTSLANANGRPNVMPQPINYDEPSRFSGLYKEDKTRHIATQIAIDYVVNNCQDKLTLNDAADLCCMSKSHFSRSFKKNHGITFQGFVMQQRINKAATLLKRTDVTVTEVALSVGFSDLSHFNRAFQKCIGMGPSRFRLGSSENC